MGLAQKGLFSHKGKIDELFSLETSPITRLSSAVCSLLYYELKTIKHGLILYMSTQWQPLSFLQILTNLFTQSKFTLELCVDLLIVVIVLINILRTY